MPKEIMTLLGPISPDQLGITLPHEHLLADLYRMTGDPNQLLNDALLAIQEVSRFREAGGATMVDATTRGLGRNPEIIQHIARETGLNIVMGCGWYREPYYDPVLNEQYVNVIADDMVRDITQGVGETGIKAGVIGEIGCFRSFISAVEERVFRAAARAHKRTDLTITTHAVRSPVGLDQLDLLEEEKVDLRRVIVGHCDTYPSPDYHEAVAKRGAYVQFDTIRGNSEWDTEQRIKWVVSLIEKGYVNQILLSHDVCMKSHLHAYGGNGYDYLLTGFIPRLKAAGVSEEQVHILIQENPKNALVGFS